LAESQKTESPIFLVAEKHVLNVMIRDNNKKKPTCPAPQLHLVSPCLVPASCSRDVSVALVTHLELLSSKRGAQQAQGLKPRSRCAPLAAIPSPYGQESESDGGWRSDDCVQVDGVVARDDVMDSIGRGIPHPGPKNGCKLIDLNSFQKFVLKPGAGRATVTVRCRQCKRGDM